ncbi:unnamed protein product [Diplocarpon coronariae]|nr:pyridoxamine phosphate oxidase [Diplocarpon mali]
MGTFYETIPKNLVAWILQQKVFWIASAPLSASGHVNVSPKGGQYFGVVDERTFWYIDLTGSGVETLSHLHEPGNGRITVLFNAFSGAPKIVRLWGHGEVLEYGTADFQAFVKKHEVNPIAGTRAVVLVHIHQVGSSCGFSMPLYDFQAFRTTLNDFFEKRVASEEAGKREDGIERYLRPPWILLFYPLLSSPLLSSPLFSSPLRSAPLLSSLPSDRAPRYWAYKNSLSMDLLPGLQRGLETGKREAVKPITKMVGPLAPRAGPRRRRRDGERSRVVAMLVLAFGAGALVQACFMSSMGKGGCGGVPEQQGGSGIKIQQREGRETMSTHVNEVSRGACFSIVISSLRVTGAPAQRALPLLSTPAEIHAPRHSQFSRARSLYRAQRRITAERRAGTGSYVYSLQS